MGARVGWTFEIPTGLRFSCTACGDCCRSGDVPLAPGERRRLAALDWEGRVERLVGVEPAVAPPRGGGRHRLPRRDDGACTYLGDDSLCLIHEHFGADAKPLACRHYPFSFERMDGDSVAVDVSLACRAVSEGRGAPLAERTAEWTALLGEVGDPPRVAHRLDARQALPAPILAELEGHLLDLLGAGSGETRDDVARLDVLDRARCCLELSRLATTGDPTTDAARSLRSAIASAIAAQVAARPPEGTMDRSQREIFFQWVFLALNPAPANLDLLRSKRLESVKRQRLAVARRHADASARPRILDADLTATFEQVAAVDVGRRGPDAAGLLADEDAQLRRFFESRIVGHRFLRAGDAHEPFVSAVPKLFAWLPVLLWAAKAFAADRGASRAEAEDLRRAIRLVDRSVGYLSTSVLPKRVARACDFVFLETDFVTCATLDVVEGRV